jgi:hypothetical protein
MRKRNAFLPELKGLLSQPSAASRFRICDCTPSAPITTSPHTTCPVSKVIVASWGSTSLILLATCRVTGIPSPEEERAILFNFS